MANREEEPKTFVLYKDTGALLEFLSNEQKGILFQSIFNYETGKNLLEMEMPTQIVFQTIKQYLDRNDEKYRKRCETNSENGKKGGRPKKTQENQSVILETQENQSVILETQENRKNPNININSDISIGIKSESDLSTHAPTLEELQAYALEKKLPQEECSKFIRYWSERGWNECTPNYKTRFLTWCNIADNEKQKSKNDTNKFNQFQQGERLSNKELEERYCSN